MNAPHTLRNAIPATLLTFALTAATHAAISTTITTDPDTLKAALNPSGLTINAISTPNGAPGQIGTYTNFSTLPVAISDGVVLSSGSVANLAPFDQPPGYADPNSGSDPNVVSPPPQVNSAMDPSGGGGTPEFDAYGSSISHGTTRIENFNASHDVAVLRVDFSLAAASQIQFDFIFGSVEYPFYTSSFTDAFLVFLDGQAPTDEITFDANGNPVQVGKSFAGLVTTTDQDTAFSSPHGVIHHLTTTTKELSEGDHTLWFEVGDVNDQILDSAAFIANLRTGTGTEGTEPTDDDLPVPEPASLSLLALAALPLLTRRRTT
ncbi:MAG: choice-of-anchor L domain-containing protein [Phycisphaerae bacterium]